MASVCLLKYVQNDTGINIIKIRHKLELTFQWVFRGSDRMVIGFTTTCAISAYHHWSCQFKSRSWRGVFDKTLCDKVCQWLPTGRWFSPDTPVSSTNTTDHHDITEIFLKVALSTITLTLLFRALQTMENGDRYILEIILYVKWKQFLTNW